MNIYSYYIYQNVLTRGKNNIMNMEMSEKKNYDLKILTVPLNHFVIRTSIILKSFNNIL